MRLSILFFAALYSGIIILSFANAESFQTINAIELVDYWDGIVSYATQDSDFLYFSTLSPVVVGKVNKTLVATPRWMGPIQKLNLSNGEVVSSGILDKESGLLLLQGQRKTFWVSTTNLSLLYSPSPLERDVNPVTAFLSNNTDDTLVANFPSYGVEQIFVMQLRLDDPSANSSTFDLPKVDIVASAYDPLNDVAVLAGYDSELFVYKWNTKELLLTFKLRDTHTTAIVYDGSTNTLYTCGHINSYIPVLARVNMTLVQNNTELLTINTNSSYYSDGVITAQAIGNNDMYCKALALHHSSGQLVYAIHDPPSSSGLIGRAVALTLDTIQTTTVDTSLSQKPIAILTDDNEPLIYVFTETEVAAVKLPTTFECPLDCSDRGHCNATTNYLCVCDEPYFGHNCESPAYVAPSIVPDPVDPITLLNLSPIDSNLTFTLTSLEDKEFLYFITHTPDIIKMKKSSVATKDEAELVLGKVRIGNRFPICSVIDTQLGLIYVVTHNGSAFEGPLLVRVPTDGLSPISMMEHHFPYSPAWLTAFVIYSANGTAPLLNFFSTSSVQYESSTKYSLDKGPVNLDQVSELPLASIYLPRSNEGIVALYWDAPLVHLDMGSGAVNKRYNLVNFYTTSLAADEERGLLYACGTFPSRIALVVLNMTRIGNNAEVQESDYAAIVDLPSPDRLCNTLTLDPVGGQIIVTLPSVIIRVNLRTNQIADKTPIDYLGVGVKSHFDTENRILFVTTQTHVGAFQVPTLCPQNCSGNGQCDYGVCQCIEGFTGKQCDEVVEPPMVQEPIEEPLALPITDITSSSVVSFSASLMLIGMVAVTNFIICKARR